MSKLYKNLLLVKEISQLEKVSIKFKNYTNKSVDNYRRTYNFFNEPHRLKLFKNKTIGVALIDLSIYDDFKEYYSSVNGKSSPAYQSRKALRRGYSFKEINRDDFINDIYEINCSAPIRQGVPMSSGYTQKEKSYINENNYRYFGILDKDGKLVAYCDIGFYGEFALVSRLLGHNSYLNDGVMYHMLVSLNQLIFEKYREIGYRYIMYDTYYGASDGLKRFKRKLGYRAYKVKWLWEN